MKIYILILESCIDGEVFFDVKPFSTIDLAKKEIENQKQLLSENHLKFSDWKNSEFEIEETETSFYINDPYDDYYENYYIQEKTLN